jgi:hypothetical protein
LVDLFDLIEAPPANPAPVEPPPTPVTTGKTWP